MEIKTFNQFKADIEAGQPHGFYHGVPNEDYHRSPGISKSGLDLISRSPAHYKFAPARKATAAMQIGTAIHSAILEPVMFERDYMLLKDVHDKRTAEYKAAVQQFGENNVLTSVEATKIKGMQEAIFANNHVMLLLSGMTYYTELSCYARDSEGTLLKCRFDAISIDGTALDLKKSRDATAYGFSRSCNEYRYHVQAAFYSYVYQLATGLPLNGFIFLAVEDDAPHYSKLYQLDSDALEIGNYLMHKNLATYKDCLKEGYWPLPDGGIETLSLPAWVISDYENKLEEGIV